MTSFHGLDLHSSNLQSQCQCQCQSLSLSLYFNGYFPDEPGLAGVFWSKWWWRWWWQLDCWSYKSNHHHQQTNIQFFTGRMPFLSPKQQCQSTEGKISYSMDLLTPSSPGVFQLCLWPLIAPGYLGGGLPCLSSALWYQYPNSSDLQWCRKASTTR